MSDDSAQRAELVEPIELLLDALHDHDAWLRVEHRVQARAAYCLGADANGTPGDNWVVEVGHTATADLSGPDEPEFQAWGPDPLAAALRCAERVYGALALARGDFTTEPKPADVPHTAERVELAVRLFDTLAMMVLSAKAIDAVIASGSLDALLDQWQAGS